jgi:hypothetical protein
MAVNLVRNARVFFTTNVNATEGTVNDAGHQAVVTTALFTQELQVLDGFTFSQNTTAETITLNESGATPKRGQRSFNTSMDPVDWSFTTYVRPRYLENTVTSGIDNDDRVVCEERVLWNAMLSSDLIGGGSAAWVETPGNATGPVAPFSRISTTNSNRNQLQKFGLIIIFDDQTYVMDNCAIESATIDFGIDQIATIAWAGKATILRRTNATVTASAGTFGGQFSGSFAQKETTAKYITNKLSAARLVSANNLFNLGATATYNLAITGGNVTIANNLTYLVPANMGVINRAIDYYTGNRSVTGSITAYLRNDANNTGPLFKQIVDGGSGASADDENMFALTLGLGGSVTAPTTTSTENKVLFYCPQAMLQIPQINSEQVVSATINFTGQGGFSTGTTPSTAVTSGTIYDVETDNEIFVTYYAGPAT